MMGRVIAKNYGYLWKIAHSITGDGKDARDLLHDSIERALKKAHQCDSRNPMGWMNTIMRHIRNDHHKQKTQHRPVIERGLFVNDAIEQNPEKELLRKELHSSLHILPFKHREILTWHLSGYKYQEIAEGMNIPMNTVKACIFKAKKELFKYFSV